MIAALCFVKCLINNGNMPTVFHNIDNNNKDLCLSYRGNGVVLQECNVRTYYNQSTKANLTLGPKRILKVVYLFISCFCCIAFLSFVKLPV